MEVEQLPIDTERLAAFNRAIEEMVAEVYKVCGVDIHTFAATGGWLKVSHDDSGLKIEALAPEDIASPSA